MSQQPNFSDDASTRGRAPGPDAGYGGSASGPMYPAGGSPGGPVYPGGQAYVDSEERSMALVAHLSTIVALIVSAGWLSFVGPLVVWFLYRDRSEFVRRSAAGAFNFNLGLWIMAIIGWICTITIIGAIIGIPLLLISAIAQLVCHILGAVRANRGELYNYPFQLRVLS